MSFSSILYTLLIYPLKQLIEVFYLVFDLTFKSSGIAVIGVSLVVTLFSLPLYIVAEDWQEKERQIQALMKDGIQRIKKTFKGDEQYMILTTFYRQHHYHPLMALRSSFALLIQIPFFIAAYSFLSNLQQLQGASFLFIRDMGKPDALFTIGNFTVNILPIMMTVINLISGAIYSKGHELREKAQIALCALVFLVILYTMPSGMVLYWTMNNLFSAVKNVGYKIPKKLLPKIIYGSMLGCYILLVCYLFRPGAIALGNRVELTIIMSWIPLLPLLLKFADRFFSGMKVLSEDSKLCTTIFILNMIFLCILAGFMLPSMVVSSSPQEFSYIDSYTSPMPFIFNSLFQAAGFTLFWPLVLYFLFSSNKKLQTSFVLISAICVTCALINCFAFSGYYGTISNGLKLDNVDDTKLFKLVNLACLVALIPLIRLLFKSRFVKFFQSFMTILIFASAAICVLNASKVSSGFKKMPVPQQVTADNVEPIYSLSKTEKNVVFIFIDQFTSSLFPAMLKKAPELKKQFSGFTYYPDCLSYGLHTIVGSPALMGGYDYRPEQINARETETLKSKITEACATLPKLFANAGYDVTFSDPGAIEALPDFLDGVENTKVVNTYGPYMDLWYQQNQGSVPAAKSMLILRNFVWFSLFKCSPVILRNIINKYEWWTTSTVNEIDNFVEAYAPYAMLPSLTDYSAEKPTFSFLYCCLPHEPMFLDAPDYTVPKDMNDIKSVDNNFSGEPRFYSASAAVHRIAEWLEELKKNGCYDNTRFIFASDHGVIIPTDKFTDNKVCQVVAVNPFLMVKDFGASGDLQQSGEFMTQCDVPYLATKDLIANPVNALGNKLTMEQKKENQRVFINHNNTEEKHGVYKYKSAPKDWYTVHDSIMNPANWTRD